MKLMLSSKLLFSRYYLYTQLKKNCGKTTRGAGGTPNRCFYRTWCYCDGTLPTGHTFDGRPPSGHCTNASPLRFLSSRRFFTRFLRWVNRDADAI